MTTYLRTSATPHVPVLRIVVGTVVGAGVLAAVFVAATSFRKTDASVVGLSYGGGVFEGRHYQRQVGPGSGLFFNGVLDKLYRYPATQRNYVISLVEDEGDRADADSIVAPSKDGIPITFQMAVTFKLNTNPETLRKFHEQLGLKYTAYGDFGEHSGWARLVNDAFRQQIENATQQSSRRFTSAQIYRDAAVLKEIERSIGRDLKTRVNLFLGDDFFCGPTFVQGTGECPEFPFVIKRADVPKDVEDSFVRIKTAENDVQVARQGIEKARADAESVRQRQSALVACVRSGIPADQCVLYEAVNKGGINFWVIPESGGVAITRPGPTE